MNLNCETILDLYRYKNGKILCQIKINPKSRKFKNSCRWLSQEQWMSFDNELEKLLSAKYWNDGKGHKFNIKPYIVVNVQKSKLSLKHFYQCIGINDGCNKNDKADKMESILVLECLIDFQMEVPLSSSVDSQQYDNQSIPNSLLCRPLRCEPYKAAKKILAVNNEDIITNPFIDFLDCNEVTYTPKPLFGVDAVDVPSINVIPKYTPAPINAKSRSKEICTDNYTDLLYGVTIETDMSPGKYNLSGTESNKQPKIIEYIPKSQEVSKIDVPVYIPTPIEETTRPKALKADNIRKNKKRSNTIDVFPEKLGEIIEGKEISQLVEQDHKELQSHRYNKKLKKRSMTIDEIPVTPMDIPVYIPTPIVEKVTENEFPERSEAYVKEKHTYKREQYVTTEKYDHCKSKVLNKCSLRIDKVPAILEHSKEKIKSHKSVEKKNKTNEKCYKMPSSNQSESLTTCFIKLKMPQTNQSLLYDNKLESVTKELNAKLFVATEKEIENDLKPCNYGKNIKGLNIPGVLTEPFNANTTAKGTYKEQQMSRKEIRDYSKIKDKIASLESFEKKNETTEKSSSSDDFSSNSKGLAKIKPIQSDNKLKRDVKPLMGCSFSGGTNTEKEVKGNKKTENSSTITSKSLRQYKQSSSKPKVVNGNNCKKYKILPKNKELFGTDDDEDDCLDNNNSGNISNDNNNKLKAPSSENFVNKKSTSSSASKKRKVDKICETDRKKNGRSKYFSKEGDDTDSCPKSVPPALTTLKLFSKKKKEPQKN